MAERLQINDQQRRSMLADISHELRTPITVIQGNVEGILDGLYPADEARLKSIIEETQILSRLVDDLRTLALAESGALYLKREPTNLAELIRDAVSGFASQAKEEDIKLQLSLDTVEDADVDSEAALAWICSSDSCKVWQRIITYEDSQSAARPCPLCKSPMDKGTKMLPRKTT